MGYPQTFISVRKTPTADTMFKLVTADMWFEEVNIHVSTHSAKYGDLLARHETITAGDIVPFSNPINLNDVFFENNTAGDNTVVTAVGVLMLPARMRELGLD